jgi:hypothetical protein
MALQIVPREVNATEPRPCGCYSRAKGLSMPYTLSQLAPGSYDVLLHGVIIASLVQSGRTDDATWTAELLLDLTPEGRPTPFTEAEHRFRNLEEARQVAWGR